MARRTSRRKRYRLPRERRSGNERRSGRDRRGEAHDLYQTDLDRHLWTFPGSRARQRKSARRKKSLKRRIARVVASTIGVAGLAYFLYRRSRGDAEMRPDDVVTAPKDAATDKEDEGAGV